MSEQHPNQQYYSEDEITLKELILKLQEFWRELWRNWWLIGLIVIPFVGYFAYKAISHVPTYAAKLTFMVNEEEGGGGMAGLGGIASSFGLNIGGGGGSINMAKVMELSKSRKITQKGVFEKVVIGGREDYIANHIIDVFDFHQDWEKGYKEGSIDLREFKFLNDDFDSFGLKEQAALNSINYQLHGGATDSPDDQIFSGGQDEDTGIMSFSAVTPQEELSIAISHALYDQLSAFYVEKAIEPQEDTYATVASKCDSLLSELKKAEYGLASFEDSSRGLRNQTSRLQEGRLSRQVQILTVAYGECLKNLEMADFSLKSARPVFQTIDNPVSPIEPSRESLLKNLIIGGFLGGFLGAAWIVARKIYRDAMS